MYSLVESEVARTEEDSKAGWCCLDPLTRVIACGDLFQRVASFLLGVLGPSPLNLVGKHIRRRVETMAVKLVELEAGEAGELRYMQWGEEVVALRLYEFTLAQVNFLTVLYCALDHGVCHYARGERISVHHIKPSERWHAFLHAI